MRLKNIVITNSDLKVGCHCCNSEVGACYDRFTAPLRSKACCNCKQYNYLKAILLNVL